MTDRIIVKDLKVWCHIGVSDDERLKAQPLYVDIESAYDLSLAGNTDALENTVDYRLICDEVSLISNSSHTTIEGFAEKAAARIKSRFLVKSVLIRVKKPRALEKRGARYAAIEIER